MAKKNLERDEAAVSEFVERFAAQLVEAGMTRMPARVFAALLASKEGILTATELGESLQISAGAVSGAIRYLTQVGLVGREREPGSRRERYRVHSNQWYETFTRRDHLLSRWEHTLNEGVDALGPDTPAGIRVAETSAFFAFLQSELASMMKRWSEHKDGLQTPKRSS